MPCQRPTKRKPAGGKAGGLEESRHADESGMRKRPLNKNFYRQTSDGRVYICAYLVPHERSTTQEDKSDVKGCPGYV